jgi:hypothetical protein
VADTYTATSVWAALPELFTYDIENVGVGVPRVNGDALRIWTAIGICNCGPVVSRVMNFGVTGVVVQFGVIVNRTPEGVAMSAVALVVGALTPFTVTEAQVGGAGLVGSIQNGAPPKALDVTKTFWEGPLV